MQIQTLRKLANREEVDYQFLMSAFYGGSALRILYGLKGSDKSNS